MFISGITPAQGPADAATTVTITGQGFVGPVSVTTNIASVPTWTVLSVAGTQIVAQALPIPDNNRTCTDQSATITVTNLDSNLKSDPTGTFTYSAVRPLITSVQIGGGSNVVTCTAVTGGSTVTIKGSGFVGPTANVSFQYIGPVVGTVVDANTITVNLPDLSTINLQQVPCNGGTGLQFVQTAVGVSVTNVNSGCSNTLPNAILIDPPCSNPCVAPPTPTPTPTATPTATPTPTPTATPTP